MRHDIRCAACGAFIAYDDAHYSPQGWHYEPGGDAILDDPEMICGKCDKAERARYDAAFDALIGPLR